MTLIERLIRLCDSYVALGSAVTEQQAAILLEGEDAEDQNPNALREASQWMRGAALFMAEVGGSNGYAFYEIDTAADTLEEAADLAIG